jgi:hypothetical protein
MAGFPSPFGNTSDEALFDGYDEFVPEHLPEPGAFLDGHQILTGDDHLAVHRLTRELFEERTVYDMTFNYNLARLNLDTRHDNAGYRYAEHRDNPSVLRAEFTPTTPFCPQTHTLTIGSFRAWNGLSQRHEYDLVGVRVAEAHHQSDEINERLAKLETELRSTGRIPDTSDRTVGPSLSDREAAGDPDTPNTPF